MVFCVGARNLFNSKQFYISYEKISQYIKKLDFCLYFNCMYFFFAIIIAKMITKIEKTMITITWNDQTVGEVL